MSVVYGEFLSESTISHNQALNLTRSRSLVLHNEKIRQPLALITTITLQVQNLKITSKFVMELAHTCSTDLIVHPETIINDLILLPERNIKL